MNKALLLNNTANVNHHGCRFVSHQLEKNLQSKCHVKIIKRYDVSSNYFLDCDFNKALEEIDCVIINGEGTPHDGSADGKIILEIVRYTKKPVFLLNTIYENNPHEWLEYLNQMSLIAVRDQNSYRNLKGNVDVPLYQTADISLYEACDNDYKQRFSERTKFIFGDSVLRNVKKQLFDLSKQNNSLYLPINSTQKYQSLRQLIYRLKLLVTCVYNRNIRFFKSHVEYIAAIKKAKMYVTGRFHTVCLCIRCGVPFVAITSNTRKIQYLLTEIGLEGRVFEEIDNGFFVDNIKHNNWNYSDEEYAKIEQFLQNNDQSWNAVFMQIKKILKNEKGV